MAEVRASKGLEDGVYVVGMYTGWETFKGERGESVSVGVLAGRDVQRVYLDGDGGGELQAHERGERVLVRARPYANKKGFLSWAGGEVLAWLDDEEDGQE